jgi:hypothetical protein
VGGFLFIPIYIIISIYSFIERYTVGTAEL